MSTSDGVKITDIIKIDSVIKDILSTSTVAWDQFIGRTALDRWLTNFTGEALGNSEDEQALAAWLLMNFTYYTQSEVEEMCKILYQKFIHLKLQSSPYKESTDNIVEKIRKILSKTVFTHLGNPGESGAYVLYSFRATNSLPAELFKTVDEIIQDITSSKIDDLVLIDDVTLSGEQAVTYIEKFPSMPVATTLLTFFATQTAITKIAQDAPEIKPMYVYFLDERTKLFSANSHIFSSQQSQQLKASANTLCLHYGNKIVQQELSDVAKYMSSYPLGFDNGQQMFAFYYNTPDNTLPIFWCDSANWTAIFPRRNKIHDLEGVKISDEHYW